MRIHRMRGEQGTSLLLALAFIALLGVFTVAILGVSFSDLKTTTVVRTRTDMLYGADGAADYALAQVQDTAGCLSSGSVTPPTLNGSSSTVTYACSGGTQTQTSTNAFMGSYSLIARGVSTGYGIYIDGSIQPTNNPPLIMNIYGDAFSEGRDWLTAGSTSDANKLVINGSLAIGGSPCAWNSTTDPQVSGSCLTNQAPPPITPNPPTIIVPSASAPAMKTGTGGNANCRILYPGKYGTGGRAWPSMDATKGWYLASGTYYFNDVQPTLKGFIQGGGQQTSTSPSVVTNPLMTNFRTRCPTSYANDANAKTLTSSYAYTGSGVTFVLGGNSRFNFEDTATTQVEFFPRVPGSVGTNPDRLATPGVSIWARMNSSSGASGTYVRSNLYDQTWTQNHKLLDVVVHGFTYMPDSKLYVSPITNSDAGGVAQLEGGAYLEKINLYSNNNKGTAPIAGKPSTVVAGPRTVTFTVTTRQAGQSSCTATYPCTVLSIVAVYPTNGSTPDIQSWRKTSAT